MGRTSVWHRIAKVATALLVIALLAAPVLAATISASASIEFGSYGHGMTNPPSGDIAKTLIVNRPSEVSAGDFLLAQITFESGSNLAVTSPPGWSLVLRTNQSTDLGQAIYSRTAGDSEPAYYSWTFNIPVKAAGTVIRYTNIDTSNPIVSSSGNSGSSDTLTGGSIYAEANSMLVAFFGIKKKDTPLTIPEHMSQRYLYQNPQDVRIMAADELRASDGDTGDRVSIAGAADNWVGHLIALRCRCADLVLAKFVDTPKPNVGDTVTFTVMITNTGPGISKYIEITDKLPDSLEYQSHSATQGTYDPDSGLWQVGNLADRANAWLSVKARVNSTGVFTNTATITRFHHPDRNMANHSDSVSVYICQPPPEVADLVVLKSVDNAHPHEGAMINFMVTVINTGPSNATNIRIEDQLPGTVTYQSHSSNAGTTYDPDTGIWTIPALEYNTGATLTVAAIVNAGTGGSTSTNTANVTAVNQADPDWADNSNTAIFFPLPGYGHPPTPPSPARGVSIFPNACIGIGATLLVGTIICFVHGRFLPPGPKRFRYSIMRAKGYRQAAIRFVIRDIEVILPLSHPYLRKIISRKSPR